MTLFSRAPFHNDGSAVWQFKQKDFYKKKQQHFEAWLIFILFL